MVGWLIYTAFLVILALGTFFNGRVYQAGGNPEFTVHYFLKVVLNPQFFMVLLLGFAGAILRMFLFKKFGISQALIMAEAVVIFNVVFAAVLFHEPLSPKFLLGCIVIALGVLIIQVN